MRTLTTSLVLAAAVSAGFVLMAAMPAQPVATGSGTFPSSMGLGPLQLEFSLIELPNGQLAGHGSQLAVNVGGSFEFDLTSYALLNGVMCMAGPITASVNSPFAVGDTWVLCVEDNGDGGSGIPDRISEAYVPIPGLTIQAILSGFPGFLPPPDDQFTPTTSGNFTIH